MTFTPVRQDRPQPRPTPPPPPFAAPHDSHDYSRPVPMPRPTPTPPRDGEFSYDASWQRESAFRYEGPALAVEATDRGAFVEGHLLAAQNGGTEASVLPLELGYGEWERDGIRNTGLLFDTKLVDLHTDQDAPVSGSLALGGLYGHATVSDETASLGLGGYVVSGSVQLQDLDPERSDGRSATIGMSAGLAVGGRLHYGDANDNGYPEYGLGFDVPLPGFPSVDYRTEDPVRDVAAAITPDSLEPWAFPEGNMTEIAGNAIWSAADSVADTVGGWFD